MTDAGTNFDNKPRRDPLGLIVGGAVAAVSLVVALVVALVVRDRRLMERARLEAVAAAAAARRRLWPLQRRRAQIAEGVSEPAVDAGFLFPASLRLRFISSAGSQPPADDRFQQVWLGVRGSTWLGWWLSNEAGEPGSSEEEPVVTSVPWVGELSPASVSGPIRGTRSLPLPDRIGYAGEPCGVDAWFDEACDVVHGGRQLAVTADQLTSLFARAR